MKDLSLPPATESYLKNFYEKVFVPLVRGESTIVYALPKSGLNSLVKYMQSYGIDRLELKKPTYTALTVTLAEDSTYNLYDDIFSSLNIVLKTEAASVGGDTESLVKEYLTNLSTTQHIVIIVQNAAILDCETHLLEQLISIHTINTVFIKFLFLVNNEWDSSIESGVRAKFGVNSVSYVPLRDTADIMVLLDNDQVWNGTSVTPDDKAQIAKLAGGYSALARQLLNLYLTKRIDSSFDIAEICSFKDVKVWCNLVFSSLSDQSKAALSPFLHKRSIPIADDIELTDFIKLTEIVKLNGSSMELFSDLFREFLFEIAMSQGFIQIVDNKMYKFGVEVKDLLSPQEWILFQYLYEHKNTLVTRDAIAKCIWGSTWMDKYSDWAIDKLVYKLRKKLGDSKADFIKSEKGKGITLNI